jgi:hypothetical protein
MANRTVKFIGYTTDNTTVVFNFNGTEVFNGAIAPQGNVSAPVELFTFDIDQTLGGTISGTITTSGGAISVVALSANYSHAIHPAGVDSDGNAIAEVTSDDLVNNYEWFDSSRNTSKQNIVIDGVAYDKGDTNGMDGAWHINLSDGQSMTCDWVVDATPV